MHGPDVENAMIDEMQDEVEVVESINDHNSMLKLLEDGRAAVDAQQLRLVTMAFEDRCKPFPDREPQQLLYQRRQTTIDDWAVSHKTKYGSTSMAPPRGPRHSG